MLLELLQAILKLIVWVTFPSDKQSSTFNCNIKYTRGYNIYFKMPKIHVECHEEIKVNKIENVSCKQARFREDVGFK